MMHFKKLLRMWKLLAAITTVFIGVFSFFGFKTKEKPPSPEDDRNWLEKWFLSYQKFNESYASERVYVHFDKPFYKPSETIWFQAYVQDEQTLKPSSQSDILHVELIDPKGNTTKKLQLILEEGTASGEFELPKDAAGGLYKVKAYTKWQENFANTLFFEKELTVQKVVLPRLKMKLDFEKDTYGKGDNVIANLDLQTLTNQPLANHELNFVVSLGGKEVLKEKAQTTTDGRAKLTFELPKDLNTSDGLLNVMLSHNGQTESISRAIPIKNLVFDLQFFPEGGDLVANTRNNVAFWCKDEFGKPADVEGVILNKKGKEVAKFSAFHKGMGQTDFVVEENETYTAKITSPKGVEKVYALPELLNVGYGLKIDYPIPAQQYKKGEQVERIYETDNLNFVIYSPVDEEVYLTATVRNEPVFSQKIQAKKGENSIVVDTKKLPIGVARFTLFDNRQIERAERLVFINAEKQLHVSLKTDKEKYQPREKVTIDVVVTDHRGIPMPANLSIAVVDDKLLSFADDKSSTILSHMLLESDLKGKVEEPRFYFDKKEHKAIQARDLLMLTHGWRKFTWQDVQKLAIPITQQAEKAVIAGHVFKNGKGVKEAKVSIDGKKITTLTDSTGYFEFKNIKLYEPLNLIATKDDLHSSFYTVSYSNNINITLRERILRKTGAVNRAFGGIVENQPAREEAEMAWMGADGEDRLVVGDVEVKPDNVNIELENIPAVADQVPLIEENIEVVAAKPIIIDRRLEKDEFFDDEQQNVTPVYYRARVFPQISYKENEKSTTRNDFRSTIFWSGNLKVDTKGKAKVEFYNSDQITSFRITCEGIASDGTLGRAESVYFTQLPFSLDAKLPLFMSMGDKITIPLTLQNNTNQEIQGYVTTDYPSAWIAINEKIWKERTTLQPNETKVLNMNFLVDNQAGEGKFLVQFVGNNGIQDRFEQDVEIFAKGFPASIAFSGEETNKTYSFEILNPVLGTSKAKFTAFPSVLDDLLAGIESILREPYGCFEQTSSSTYPNLLVLDYLSTQKNLNLEQQKALARAKELTEQGYKRLISFETKDNGYEWFGANPPHEALTAYGLMEFRDMQAVTGSLVSEEMVKRTADWLMKRKDGKGGFERNPNALDSFGRADEDITNAYITYSLSEAGYQNIQQEVEACYKNATNSKDPYLIALVVNTLQNVKDERSEKLLEQLLSLQKQNANQHIIWEGSKHSITCSTGQGLTAETTSLAVLALMKSTQKRTAILQNAVKGLVGMRSSYGGFGNTQSTVLALKALTTYAKYAQRTPEKGDIAILINGQKVATAHYEADEQNAIEVTNLEKYLKQGKNTVQITYLNVKQPLPYTFAAEWHTDLPQSSKECSIALTTKLAQTKAKVGETVRMTSVITNKTSEGKPMTIAILGIPGGLSPQPWQLKELIEKNQVAFYEIREHSVVLYWRDIKPSESKTIHLDLKANLAGEYEGAASSVYLYYTSEFKDWQPAMRLKIE